MILFADLETFSEVPLKHGTHRYSEGVEVLLTAWAEDDDDVRVEEGLPDAFIDAASCADKIVFHNMKFDRTVLGAIGLDLPPERLHCTMAQARSVGLPGGLAMLCDVLGVPVDKAKDKAGRQFINLFCKPRPKTSKVRRATRATHPVEWARFVDYAGLDVVSMREVYRRLPKWNYINGEYALWQLDQRINDRGFAIDLDLARAAITAVNAEQKRLARQTQDLTDGEVESTSQRDKLIAHLLEQHGVTLPNMQKATLERRVTDEELPAAVRELLAIRLEASTTSTAKYQALVNATSSDGRLRGALEWCGAARTGRWSGRLFQPQNLPRTPDWFDREEQTTTIEALKCGAADLIYPDLMKRCSLAIRGAIVAAEGKKLVVADLSNIEGRIIAWLADEEWKLEAFRQFDKGIGADLYIIAYARSFGVKVESVGKDQRQLGKVQELALGYQGGVGAFVSMVMTYRIDLHALAEAVWSVATEGAIGKAKGQHDRAKQDNRLYGLSERIWIACQIVVNAWRAAHPNVVEFWYALESRARDAVRNPGVTLTFGRLKLRRDGAWFKIVLPSGRALCYASPKINEAGQLSYMGVNQYTRRWERIATYGGKLAENVTQAVARDCLADAMQRGEDAGYQVVLTCHDEIVVETPDDPKFSTEGLIEIMTTNPGWAEGLPLAAAGFEGKRYGKE